MTRRRLSIPTFGYVALLAVGGQACPLESLNREHWVPLDSAEGDQVCQCQNLATRTASSFLPKEGS